MPSLLLCLSGCSGKEGLLSSSGEQQADDVYFAEKERSTLAASSKEQEGKKKDARPDYFDPEVAADLQMESLRNRDNIQYTPLEGNYTGSEWKKGPRYRFQGENGTPIGPEHLNTDRYWYYTRYLRQKNPAPCPSSAMKEDKKDRRNYEHGSGGDASGVDFGTDGDPSDSTGDKNSSSGRDRRSSEGGGNSNSGRRP